MPLRRSGPYAPQRPAVTIDWAGMRADADRMRAEQARVDEQAREAARAFREEADPVAQLVRRCHGIDVRQDALEARLAVLEEHVQTIINHQLNGRDG